MATALNFLEWAIHGPPSAWSNTCEEYQNKVSIVGITGSLPQNVSTNDKAYVQICIGRYQCQDSRAMERRATKRKNDVDFMSRCSPTLGFRACSSVSRAFFSASRLLGQGALLKMDVALASMSGILTDMCSCRTPCFVAYPTLWL